tara:strand:+ start:212 stop:499 length:288 start_codon:yes stop_codon:yes gene_type:complete
VKVNEETVKEIAELANFRIEKKDEKDLIIGMQKILDMASSLDEAETNGVTPMANPHDSRQILRDDVCQDVEQRDFFLALAPLADGGFFLVPKVVE